VATREGKEGGESGARAIFEGVMAAAALPLVVAYMLETKSEQQMQSLAQWRSAVWLASTCRELRKESTAKRELAALQWVHSSRFAMFQVLNAVRQMPHPLDSEFYSPRVEGTYEMLNELSDMMGKEDLACALLDEDGALARIRNLLPFMLRARDRLRWASNMLNDEYAEYYKRLRITPRRSLRSIPGLATLALEELEFEMQWRRDRPFRDSFFRPLGD
jgi:hypothetical protein